MAAQTKTLGVYVFKMGVMQPDPFDLARFVSAQERRAKVHGGRRAPRPSNPPGTVAGPRHFAHDGAMAPRGNTRLVYSTGTGRMCPDCGKPPHDCRCGSRRQADEPVPVRVVARLRVEKAGRGGKTVTVLYDLPRNSAFLEDLCRDLKRGCGVGGAVRGDGLELQGDVRDRIREVLVKRGFGVKG